MTAQKSNSNTVMCNFQIFRHKYYSVLYSVSRVTFKSNGLLVTINSTNEQTRESKCSECDPGYGNINTMVKIENNVLYTCLCCVWMSVLGHVMNTTDTNININI